MNMSLIVAALCAAMVFPVHANVEARQASSDTEATVVLPERMNLRAGPNMHARVLRGLPRGASGRVLQAQGDWSQIRVFGTLGWVHVATRFPTTMEAPPMPPLPRAAAPASVQTPGAGPTQGEHRTTIATIQPVPRAASSGAASGASDPARGRELQLAVALSVVLILLASWSILLWLRTGTQRRAFGFLDDGLYTSFSEDLGAAA